MKKKRLSALLLAASMLLALPACSNDAPPPSSSSETSSTSTPAPNAEATKLTFWTFQELHVGFYEEMQKQWNEANPDKQIDFDFVVYPFDEMHNKLTMAFQSGTGAPDMVDIEIGKYANYLKGDIQLLPLNDIIEPELPNIVRSRVDIYAKDNNFYGIDFHVGAAVTFYNTEILDAANVDYKTIKTWDDYYEAAKKVKEATNKPFVSLESTDVWHMLPMIYSQGSDILSDDGKPQINTPEMAKALEYNQKLLEEDLAIVAPGDYHHSEEFYSLMGGGGVASITMPFWYLNRFTDYMPDLSGKMAIAPCPVWEDGQPRSVGLGGTGTSVTKQSQHADLVKEFLAYAKLSKEGNIQIWKQLGFDPIRPEVWSMAELHDDTESVFMKYFVTNPFDVLSEIKDEIPAHKVSEALPSTQDMLKNTVLSKAYNDRVKDIPAMLDEAEGNIIY